MVLGVLAAWGGISWAAIRLLAPLAPSRASRPAATITKEAA